MIEGLRRDQKIIVMKNELASSSLAIESGHLVGNSLHIALAKTFAGSQLMERRNAAVRTASIATATSHHLTGGHAGKHVNRAATVGERQGIEVIGGAARSGEANLRSVTIGDAGDLRQTSFRVRHGVRDLDQRVFSFVNHDDVDFWMMRQQRFSGAGSIVAASDNELPRIGRLQPLRQTEKFLRAGLEK